MKDEGDGVKAGPHAKRSFSSLVLTYSKSDIP